MLEAQISMLNITLVEKDKEISGKDYQMRQARTFVQEEHSARKDAEAERDELQHFGIFR